MLTILVCNGAFEKERDGNLEKDVKMLKHFGHFESVHLVFGKIFRLYWPICYAIRQNFISVNSQKY